MFFVCFSIALAEDLYVLDKEPVDIESVVALEGVDVYAIMQAGILVGATAEGSNNLSTRGYSLISLGERDEESQYYLFRIIRQDMTELATGIEVVYYRDDEAIAKTKARLDPQSALLMRMLTHISFIPKPSLEKKSGVPSLNLITDPEIEEIVNQVSQAEYTAYIQSLQDFVTRYSYTESCRAAEQWAVDEFESLGYETELFPYEYDFDTWYNAIGRKEGLVYPDSIYMIIGHIDATSENPDYSAPGAEDNGSGSACVLEAARILSQYDFNCTIEFVLVSGEEQGLIGSEAYAEYCYFNGRNVGGVLNFDMIAYEGGYGWDTNIYSDQTFPAEVVLADLLAFLTDDYSSAFSIRVNTIGPQYGSDHYYFSYYGFPATFSIDAQLWGAPDFYPWYHTTDDVIANLDLDYATEVVKGGVATLATVAGLWSPPLIEFVYPEGLPDLIAPVGGTSFRVEVIPGASNPQPGTGILYYSTGGDFANIPMEIVSPNVYDAVFPALECGLEVPFYVSAETEDGTLVTDPLTAPDVSYSTFSAVDLISVFEDDFNTDQGWIVENDCSDGQWERGIPAGGGDRGDPPSDYDGSDYCYITDNEDGDSDVDNGYTWLISPAFDLSEGDAIISYALWYTNNAGNSPNSDIFNVHISNDDGVNWTLVETYGPHTAAGWTEQSFRVAESIPPSSQIRVRFEASDLGDGSVVEAGIDAFSVKIIECDTTEVPTLSEWGMIILTLLLLALGTIAVVRRIAAYSEAP
jgi:hypothetical protein